MEHNHKLIVDESEVKRTQAAVGVPPAENIKGHAPISLKAFKAQDQQLLHDISNNVEEIPPPQLIPRPLQSAMTN